LKHSFFDYPIFQIADLEEFSGSLSGNCQKGVLVVVADELTDERLAYLQKILGAAQLNLSEDCFLLRGGMDDDSTKTLPSLGQLRTLQAAHHANTPLSKLVCFGVNPSVLGLNVQIPPYTPTLLAETTILYADKLADIEPSPERRKALWGCLQKMFL
jgi:hypothetical protein